VKAAFVCFQALPQNLATGLENTNTFSEDRQADSMESNLELAGYESKIFISLPHPTTDKQNTVRVLN
jgi:hypothetical protein